MRYVSSLFILSLITFTPIHSYPLPLPDSTSSLDGSGDSSDLTKTIMEYAPTVMAFFSVIWWHSTEQSKRRKTTTGLSAFLAACGATATGISIAVENSLSSTTLFAQSTGLCIASALQYICDKKTKKESPQRGNEEK